jgi:hypothetical protein
MRSTIIFILIIEYGLAFQVGVNIRSYKTLLYDATGGTRLGKIFLWLLILEGMLF